MVPTHVNAAAQLGTVADAVQYALTWAATAGAIFYAALAVIVLELIGGYALGLGAGASVVGATAGVVILLTTTAAVIVQLGMLLHTFAEAYARLQIWMYEMLSEARNNTAFPGGGWPSAQAARYADGTVRDGDADWSVAPA
jgi:hypothetical protein